MTARPQLARHRTLPSADWQQLSTDVRAGALLLAAAIIITLLLTAVAAA